MTISLKRGAGRHQSGKTRRGSARALAATAVAMALFGVSTAAVAQGNPVSHAYLTGVWKEDQQCRGGEAMIFFANNTMSSSGSVPVNYTVTGPAQILMYGPGGSVPIQTQYVSQDKMVVTFQNDATVLHRCGGGVPAQNNNAQLSQSYITGGWGQNGNCANPEVFSAGGHLRTSQGDAGTWALFGNTLRLTVNNGNSLDFTAHASGNRNLTLIQNNNGQASNYTRCF